MPQAVIVLILGAAVAAFFIHKINRTMTKRQPGLSSSRRVSVS